MKKESPRKERKGRKAGTRFNPAPEVSNDFSA
jgi:hypothetical protein